MPVPHFPIAMGDGTTWPVAAERWERLFSPVAGVQGTHVPAHLHVTFSSLPHGEHGRWVLWGH